MVNWSLALASYKIQKEFGKHATVNQPPFNSSNEIIPDRQEEEGGEFKRFTGALHAQTI